MAKISVKVTGSINLGKEAKNDLIKQIIKKVPQAAPHKTKIKFDKTGVDLSDIPIEVAEKIKAAFQ